MWADYASQLRLWILVPAPCKMYWKCFFNQTSLVWRPLATWFWRWRCAVTRCRQGMTESFTDTLYSCAKTSSSVHQKAVFSYRFSRARQPRIMLRIKKSFRHALHLVTAHLHRKNQVAHALRSRDFWLEKLSIHFQYIMHGACTSIP